MQVLCKVSKSQGEIRCKICGQGFLVYWARTSRTEREAARQRIAEALAAHHADSVSEQVHPRTGFTVPFWHRPPALAGAALLGGAQGWSI
jgi:hypothetical protein